MQYVLNAIEGIEGFANSLTDYNIIVSDNLDDVSFAFRKIARSTPLTLGIYILPLYYNPKAITSLLDDLMYKKQWTNQKKMLAACSTEVYENRDKEHDANISFWKLNKNNDIYELELLNETNDNLP